VIPEDLLEGAGLGEVAERGRRPVRVDVADSLRLDTRQDTTEGELPPIAGWILLALTLHRRDVAATIPRHGTAVVISVDGGG